jgi:hypothetical protein
LIEIATILRKGARTRSWGCASLHSRGTDANGYGPEVGKPHLTVSRRCPGPMLAARRPNLGRGAFMRSASAASLAAHRWRLGNASGPSTGSLPGCIIAGMVAQSTWRRTSWQMASGWEWLASMTVHKSFRERRSGSVWVRHVVATTIHPPTVALLFPIQVGSPQHVGGARCCPWRFQPDAAGSLRFHDCRALGRPVLGAAGAARDA